MRTTSAWERLGLWRVTRHPLAKRAYDALHDAGVHVARLDRFGRDATRDVGEGPTTDAIDDVVVHRARDGLPDTLAEDPVSPDDRVLSAVRDGATVGHLLLSNRPVWVPALGRRVSVPGAYVWRVYVSPEARGRGIGTALVREAVAVARPTFGVDRVHALVAPDNVPSRRAFASVGFVRDGRYTTVGVAGRQWTWVEADP